MEVIKKVKDEKKNVLKVIVLGDVNVGKSNIIRRILGKDFEDLEATVGVEFAYIDINQVDPSNPEYSICIQIWDTSGAERYRAITTNHIRDADGCILVYDIANRSSFDNIEFWLEILKSACADDVVVYVIGNKADLPNQQPYLRKVIKEDAINFCKKIKCSGFGECSALNNINIKEIFHSFCKTLFKKNKGKLEEKSINRANQLENMKIKHSNKDKDCCA